MLWRPRLSLEIRPGTPIVAGTATVPGARARYFHLLCHNRHPFVNARACTAWLHAVASHSGAAFTPAPSFVGPVQLHWANTPETGPTAFGPTYVPRRSSRPLDIGFAVQGEADFRLAVPQTPGNLLRLAAGRYLLDIEVADSNASAKCKVELQVAGAWDRVRLYPFS